MLISTLTSIVSPSLVDNGVYYGGSLATDRFPTVRESDIFSFNVEIFNSVAAIILTNPAVNTPVTVDSVTLSSVNPNVIITQLTNSKFTISGQVSNVFLNRFYKFRMNDDTLQILDPSKNQNAYGVVQYQADLARFAILTYTFNVGAQQLLRFQTINNSWEVQRLIFKQTVSQGK